MGTQTRREFLSSLGCGTLTAAAALASTQQLFLMNALASTADYKALVCIFLHGGNDSNNTVVPIDDYAGYAAVRGALTLPQASLLPITPPSDGRTFGLHPNLPRLQQLWQQQRLAIVANVGPLIAPMTRTQYQSTPSLRPYQLFSHSDQQGVWESSYANGPTATGWGGRVADRLPNAGGFPTVTSLAGITVFSVGTTSNPLSLPPAPTPVYAGLRFRRLGDGWATSPLRRILNLAGAPTAPVLGAEVTDVNNRAIAASQKLNTDPLLGTPFPSTPLGNQLKQVAKLVKLGSTSLALSRQIFFCSYGDFDTHTNQGGATGNQATLLQTLDGAMGAFHDATIELGVAPLVTTFTMSDFGRTLKPGGTGAATGSDHAWGGHHFVMGDAVAGGDFYGAYPTLALNGPDDADSGAAARGRWIPTTAVDQYAATLATWFGVAPTDLPAIFPNLGRFATANLGFMRS